MGRVAGPVKASLDKICMEKPQVPPDNEYRACVNTSTRVKMVWAPGWGLSLEEDTKGECWESSRGRGTSRGRGSGEGPPPRRPQLGSVT